MSINILQGIIPILPTSKSTAYEDKKFLWLSFINKPIDHKKSPGIGDPKLTKKPHRYIPLVLGWAVKRSSGELKGNVSYSRIFMDNEIHDPDNHEIKHKITFDQDYFVSLNDHHIAMAPLKKTKAFKEKFCKAVIWSLMNDPECLKDKLKEISGNVSIPEKQINLIPVFPAGFIPWLNLTITEEVCTA